MTITSKAQRSWAHAGAMAAILALPLGGAAPAIAQDYPSAEETLDWTIAFGPGGGNDIMARTIIDILTKYDL